MAGFSLQIKLVDSRLARLSGELHQKAVDLVAATAENIAATAVDSMSGPKSGRMYRSRKGDGSMHQASAPGEAPARDTGGLAGGITVVEGANDLQRIVAVNAAHGLPLEAGAPRAHLAPRPFMDPAVESQRAAWDAGVGSLLRQAGA